MGGQAVNVGALKLKAFTVMEAVVVMVIASILVSLGAGVLLIISNQFSGIRETRMAAYELKLFDTVFTRDWNNADSIFQSGEGLIFRSHEKRVIYSFSLQGIKRRNNEHIDSFNIKVLQSTMINGTNAINFECELQMPEEKSLVLRKTRYHTPAEQIKTHTYGRY